MTIVLLSNAKGKMYDRKTSDEKWRQWGVFQKRLQEMEDDIQRKLRENNGFHKKNIV